MRRFVLLLVTLGALYWVWRGFGEGDTSRAAGPEVMGGSGTVPLEGLRLVDGPRGAPVSEGEAPGPDDAASALRRRDADALRSGYRRLLDAAAEPRARLAAALQEVAGADSTTALDALGDGNAFLHSPEGRMAAQRASALASAEAPEVAVKTFTRLLELAMRGRIEVGDAEARATVDSILAAYRSPLNRVVFNPEHLAGARSHRVAPGEVLERIARSYRSQGINLDPLTLALFNRIDDPSKVRAGQMLKVPVEPIRTVVEKRSFLMAMYVGEVIFRLYWIGHGKDDRTPETEFVVGTKNFEPTWYIDGRAIPYGHPDNILGKYFVKFEHASLQGYGAHGTPAQETIGTMASRGCIRMRDADIEEFFKVVPRGSAVVIRSTVSAGSR